MYKKPIWILTYARSGSNFLCDLLNKSNYFNSSFKEWLKEYIEYEKGIPITPLQTDLNNYILDDKIIKQLFNQKGWPNYNKVIRSQYIRSGLKDNENIELKDIKYIHLKRNDLVERSLSYYYASETNTWCCNEKNKSVEIKFDVKQAYLFYNFLKIFHDNNWKKFLQDKEFIEVDFNKLINNTKGELKRIFNFLEIEYQDNEIKNLIKQSNVYKVNNIEREKNKIKLIEYIKNKEKNKKVTVTISTKNRYNTTLPLCLESIANQSYRPYEIIVFDDNEEPEDLRNNDLYKYIFKKISRKNIKWRVIYGSKKGQIHNHQTALNIINDGWIWRIDDDEIPEYNTLEIMMSHANNENVGAISCLIHDPLNNEIYNKNTSGKIRNIKKEPNLQWQKYPKNTILYPEHLYSSFVFDRQKINHEYCMQLSQAGHREETIFTYEIYKSGYKLLVDTSACIWHYRFPEGGIRESKSENFHKDEEVFDIKINLLNKYNNKKMIYIDGGIGDHYSYKIALNSLKEKYKDIFISSAFPQVFQNENIEQISIKEGRILQNNPINIYKFMSDNKWNKNIIEAIKEKYQLNDIKLPKKIDKKDNNHIIISPYSRKLNNKINAKNYPYEYWVKIVHKMKEKGLFVEQIGVKGEDEIDGVDIFSHNTLKDLENKIINCLFFISVDNFMSAFSANLGKQGIVIFGKSDPNIFGYEHNINILKDNKYLRKNQFDFWHNEPYEKEVFVNPDNVISHIDYFLK